MWNNVVLFLIAVSMVLFSGLESLEGLAVESPSPSPLVSPSVSPVPSGKPSASPSRSPSGKKSDGKPVVLKSKKKKMQKIHEAAAKSKEQKIESIFSPKQK